MSRFVLNVAGTLATQISTTLAALITFILIARYLGPEGQGQFSVMISGLATLVILTGFGSGHSYAYHAPRTDPEEFISGAVTIILFQIVSVSIIWGLAVTFFRAAFFPSLTEETLVYAVILAPVYCLYVQTVTLLRIGLSMRSANYANLLQSFSFLAVLPIIFILNGASLTGAVFAYFVSISFGAIGSLWLMSKMFNLRLARLRIGAAVRLLGFGTRVHIGNVHKELMYKADLYLVAQILNPYQAGLYSVALKMAESILRFPDVIGVVLLPKVAASTSDNSNTITPIVCRVAFQVVTVIVLVVLVTGHLVIELLLGPEYLRVMGIFIALAPGILAITVWKLLVNDIIGRGLLFAYNRSAMAGAYTLLLLGGGFDVSVWRNRCSSE